MCRYKLCPVTGNNSPLFTGMRRGQTVQPPLTPGASELRPYFRAVYRDPSVDALPDEQLASRWARLTWVYHTPVASLALAFAQDYHHAHSSVCEAPAPTRGSAQQPGLIFCPTIKVRNLHWFGFWRPATLLHGCTKTVDPIVGGSLDEARSVAPFVEDNGWIEVTRIATRIMTGTAKYIRKFGEGGGHGCWFLGAVGSGVFMHVGRSLRVHNRTELMQRLNLPPPRGGSLYFNEMHVEICTAARQQGYVTLQLYDDVCGHRGFDAKRQKENANLRLRHACFLEVVSCHPGCTTLPPRSHFDACVDAPLATGWTVPVGDPLAIPPRSRCICNNSLTLLNCMGTAADIPPASAALMSTSALVDYAPWPAASQPFRAAVQEGCSGRGKAEAQRTYLRRVYPAGHFGDRARVSSKAVALLFHALHWYYADELAGAASLLASKIGKQARNMTAASATAAVVAPPAFECQGGRMHKRFVQRYTATAVYFPFLPCTPGPDCIGRQAGYTPKWRGHRYLEVWHFALKSKRDPPDAKALRWQQVLDSEESLWYWHAPGSGIFYDGGAVCDAPSKVHMLLRLLRAWADAPAELRASAPAVDTAVARLMGRMGEVSLGGVLARVNLTAAGVGDCSRARLDHCMFGWFLMDRWDRMLGALGRALHCDTLFYTASTWGIRQATPAGEMVDLRVKAEAAGLGKRSAAERAAGLLQLTSRRLSLRDPLAPRRRGGDSDVDIGQSLPCNFTQGRPSLRLGCPGHISWRTRDEPRYERNCRRVDRFAQAHDSAWLR